MPSGSYAEFLASKRRLAPGVGDPTVTPDQMNPTLFDFQAVISAWAVRRGRAGIFATTGLGKTAMQLSWAEKSGERSLVIAPLAVCQQTIREANRMGIDAQYLRSGGRLAPGMYVTNYEMADRFDPHHLDAVVLDEGSILRDATGATRNMLVDHFARVPRRLTCTATPRPNDAEELTNQASFLGIMPRVEMLATYFVHDDDGYRLKGHARKPMMRWMASWAIAMLSPADLGYPAEAFELPGLDIIPELLPVPIETEGQLFTTSLGGVGGRAKIRKATLEARCERAAELIAKEPDEPWLLWTALNSEADLLTKLIPGAVNVHGSMSPEEKAEKLLGFADGDIQILVTKPKIAARGLNLQRCAHMVFVGLSDSFEDYFQCIRRCHRFGQTRRVKAHIVLSELENQIATNVGRKEREADAFMRELVDAMRETQTELMAPGATL